MKWARRYLKRLVPKRLRRKWRSPLVLHFDEAFANRADFQHFIDLHPDLRNAEFIHAAARRVCQRGAIEPLTGHIIPHDRLVFTDSLREGMFHDGLNARMRAVWLAMERVMAAYAMHDPAIYAPEAITPMAMRLRGIFPRFIGSEYVEDASRAAALYPIQVQDLQALDLRADAFDLVVTNEVLEHVPSIDSALSEIHRILKPGGMHVGTMPFMYYQDESIVRARLENGQIVHLMEPEYHGNPVDPEGGALAFEIPGWNLLDRARAAGFRTAHMRFILSTAHGCICEGIGGILILEMRK
ncbi:MAG: class I SAM-dependent methyltransferase [Halothiobacillus sp.]|nr:class I SAM-dependent methyltransferase [Halothiobacillus sp.]